MVEHYPKFLRLWSLAVACLLVGCSPLKDDGCDPSQSDCGDLSGSADLSYGETVTQLAPLHNRSQSVVCGRMAADFVALEAHPVEAGSEACDPGSVSMAGQEAALRATNFARWLAGLPPISLYPGGNEIAQRCALLMSANNTISHHPTSDWVCYDEMSATGAGESNIHFGWSGGSPPTAPVYEIVRPFLLDFGAHNIHRVGHRRWFLSPSQKDMAFGYAWSPGADFYGACWHHGFDESRQVPAHPLPHITWPTPGPFPRSLLVYGEEPISWSLSWSRGLGDATEPVTVEVTRLGALADEPLEIDLLSHDNEGQGWTSAVVFQPRWGGQLGRYRISVSSGTISAQWDTEIVDCGLN